jgi:2-oxoglutarate dehydrogenase E1 component
MSDYSFIANAHPGFIAEMYDKYSIDPLSVEESWRTFFKGFDYANHSNGHAQSGTSAFNPNELKALSLIKAYRDRGHLLSTTNPIRTRRDRHPNLSIEDFGLTSSDLNQIIAEILVLNTIKLKTELKEGGFEKKLRERNPKTSFKFLWRRKSEFSKNSMDLLCLRNFFTPNM